ncbi:type II secretion system F family protein [Microvirga sp. VF16]|uniref:type II secretion system F family protein n=1 Tax=Microvirga sp. VF16 TaxID=2807101 RepID=UPI00193EAC2A|nr:type II secretion system F family protein [Microvirga sp. VF16]QRM27650.1 type II secretion system F family protein [Microvirga sp. VF16]
MLAPEFTPLVIALLATFCAGGIVIALFYSYIERRSESHKRLATIAALGNPREVSGQSFNSRKKSIESTLREIEDAQKAQKAAKPTLLGRIRQAGLSWSSRTYCALSVGAGALCLLLTLALSGLGILPALGFALAGGLLLPHLYVSFRRSRRFATFSSEFPNAVDVIVRGVKAGLPLADCLRIISQEAQEPVRGEFKLILEDQTMGLPMEQAVQRLPQRVPLPEASFFSIVISLQSRTGGSLSEALGNLSKVLRERKKMKAKIKAVSSEAKTSAGIIGALPFVVAGAIYLTAPAYIGLLFSTLIGNIVLGISAFWMMIGILVMRKMINFDF